MTYRCCGDQKVMALSPNYSQVTVVRVCVCVCSFVSVNVCVKSAGVIKQQSTDPLAVSESPPTGSVSLLFGLWE